MDAEIKIGDLVITASPFEENFAIVIDIVGEGDLKGVKVMMPNMIFTTAPMHLKKVK
jgi:hypothetical protein|tara:strand:- start:223 stop:393 length:171 start_codon:yes stop_codon:yes gene_type:complete